MSCTIFFTVARRLHTSRVSQQLIKPPVQVFSIEGRYATALYSAATKKQNLDAVEKELVKFQEQIKHDPNFIDYLKNPTIKRSMKAEGMRLVASKLSLSEQTSNLLILLAENGRLGKVNTVINNFRTIMAAHRGEVTCEVTTATELDPAHRSRLETVLKTFMKESQTLQLTSKVDPSIIGGMVVCIGDLYVDMSVASKIKKYTEVISATV